MIARFPLPMERLLQEHGVKVTANRLRVARALEGSHRPLSLRELEERLETIDKSNIFRALTCFRDAHLVHVLEDVGDGVRYELCRSRHETLDDDLHVHFYCTRCRRTFCLEDVPLPLVNAPSGYATQSLSCLLRGLCPACAR